MTRRIAIGLGILVAIAASVVTLIVLAEQARALKVAAARGDLPVLHLGRAEP